MNFNVGRKEESYPKFYFPEILISDSYKELVKSLPEEPELPVKEVVKDERRGLLTFSTILLLILVVVAFIRPDFFKNLIGTIGLLLEPGNCIKTIQSIVKSLEDHTLNWTSYVIDDSSWDEETALQMEKQGYREQYLGIVKRIRVDPFKSMSSFEDKRLPRTFDPDGDLPF